MRFCLLAAALAVSFSGSVAGDDKTTGRNSPSPLAGKGGGGGAATDSHDLLYLGARPVLIRLHVRIDGKPLAAIWDQYLHAMFRDLDLNGDGFLSKEEAERVPRAQDLIGLGQGAILDGGTPRNRGRAGGVALTDLDQNSRDEKVSFQELADFYQRSGLTAFRLQGTAPQPIRVARAGTPTATPVNPTDVLFRLLDRNRDGKLSKQEVAEAFTVLRPLDLDEDELISLQEVAPQVESPFGGVAIQPGEAATPPGDFRLLDAGVNRKLLAQALRTRYDKNANQKLEPAEIGLTAAAFAPLDVNKDGALDAEELLAFLSRQPDFVIEVPLGSTPAKAPKERWSATIGDTQLELRHGPLSGIPFSRGNARSLYAQQFKAADTDKKGFVELKQLEGTAGNGREFLRGVFTLADRDRDGKLTEKELNAFFDLHEQGTAQFATLSIVDQGRGLFELLDANGDGLLGQRELRDAWTRLAPWDRKKSGMIARVDLPRQLKLHIVRGPAVDVNGMGPGMVETTAVAPSSKGPLWFRKMDRNGDGDVSSREFLGSLDDFRKIDADGDGLIDAAEAERADVWFRKAISQDAGPKISAKTETPTR